MLDTIFDTFTDVPFMITIMSSVATMMAIIGFALPYLRPDYQAQRMRAALRRRQDIRSQQLEALQQRSRLRKAQTSTLQGIVDRLNLKKLFISDELRIKLLQANWRDANSLPKFIAMRFGGPIILGGLIGMMLFGSPNVKMKPLVKLIFTGVAILFGYYLPNILVGNSIQKRKAMLARGFPDALDLLLICVESGLSLEVAFGRVAREIGDVSPELAEEFELTTAELAYLPDRRMALENLTLRTGLPAVKAVVTTLIQAEKYGTPLTGALRTAAQESRDIRLAMAEKKAASLPAILTVPMILFFLPVLFMVILGPAFIQNSR